MNVLLIGSGGREHALAWKMAQSKKLSQLYILKGNAGTAKVGENVDIDQNDFVAVGNFCLEKKIALVVVGPEEPLVKGIKDYFLAANELKDIPVIGPSSVGAQLEGSKEFAKAFMEKYNIPTGKYKSFEKASLQEGLNYIDEIEPPYVLKADGLAAGKGVLIINDKEEAKVELKAMLEGKFGAASNKVVIEEYLEGIELSAFAITDGESYLMLPEAKDYKRIGEGDTGLNTGGMGAITPVPFASKEFMEKVENKVVKPTVEGLKKEGIPYNGFIFFGLMNKNNEPYVIEYNVRMGDPEAEVIIPRIESDLLEIFELVAAKKLASFNIQLKSDTACTVMLVSGGYPGSYPKGKTITGADTIDDSIVFHAGTSISNSDVVTSGGRVIAVTSLGKNMTEALEKSYKNVDKINFEGKNYRKDIGFDL